MEQSSYKARSAACSFRSLSAAPGGCWEWSTTDACSALTALDRSTVLLAEVCRGFRPGFPQPGYLPAGRPRDRRNGTARGAAATPGRRAVSASLPRAQDLFQAAHGQGADCLPAHLCCPHTGFKHCLQPWA